MEKISLRKLAKTNKQLLNVPKVMTIVTNAMSKAALTLRTAKSLSSRPNAL